MSQPSTVNTIQVGSEVITKLDQQPNQPSSAFDRQWTVGRAPWYDPSSSANRRPFMIGVTGGTASGKTTVCDAIVKKLGLPWVVLLSMDRFYLSLSEENLSHASNHNFDHPNAFDWNLLESTIRDLATAKSVQVPRYSFKTHQREKETDTLYGADVIIVEGILILHNKSIRDQFDMRIYVDEEDDVRLARRVKRDIAERGRTVEEVLYQYLHTVKPAFDQFIRPTKRHADLIIPHGGENFIAIDLMVDHIRHQLTKRGVVFRQAITHISNNDEMYTGTLSTSSSSQEIPAPEHKQTSTTSTTSSTTTSTKSQNESAPIPISKSMEILGLDRPQLSSTINRLPDNVIILPRTPALTAIHTILRDASTSQDDFQFHVHRVARLLLSQGLDELVAHPYGIVTPTNAVFHGIQLLSQICGVSIVRSGEALEAALRELSPDVAIGKIVINQSKTKHEGPRLYYCKFPQDVAQRKVLLLDGLLATGNAANMAVHVLLDHGVKQENIIFLSIIAAPEGIRHLLATFPRLRVITSWMEEGLDSLHFLSPGLGAFGNRYFGTISKEGESIEH